MSRIGVKPVTIPKGVKISLSGRKVVVEGKLGKLEHTLPAKIDLKLEEGLGTLSRAEETRQLKALHGLTRALLQNMVTGVEKGYEKKLEVHGVGYVAAVANGRLELRVGYANEVHLPIPEGLTVTAPQPGPTEQRRLIIVKGIDKQKVGQFAAEARAARKPEPYKGKGVRYEGEQVRRKAGKAMTK